MQKHPLLRCGLPIQETSLHILHTSAMFAPADPPRHRPPSRRPPAPGRPAAPAPLPVAQPPRWLGTIVRLQRLTTVVALGTMGAALGTYAFTVYQWQAWNQAVRQLEELRYQERSLQRTSVSLEASLAEAAERSPLVLWDPEQTLFLQAVPPLMPPLETEPSSAPERPLPTAPLAY